MIHKRSLLNKELSRKNELRLKSVSYLWIQYLNTVKAAPDVF